MSTRHLMYCIEGKLLLSLNQNALVWLKFHIEISFFMLKTSQNNTKYVLLTGTTNRKETEKRKFSECVLLGTLSVELFIVWLCTLH